MKKNLLLFIILFPAIGAIAQTQKIHVSIHIAPAISSFPVEHRVFKDGILKSVSMEKNNGLVWGGGLAVSRQLLSNFSLGAELAFASKGFFEVRDTTYSGASVSGYGFQSIDLNFMETTLYLEKKLLLKNPANKFLFSYGLFYGLHLPHVVQFSVGADGNDFGMSFSGGIQVRRFFAKLEYKKGLANIKNTSTANFTSSLAILKIGYQAL